MRWTLASLPTAWSQVSYSTAAIARVAFVWTCWVLLLFLSNCCNLFCCSHLHPSLCLPPDENLVQYATVCRAQSSCLKSFSCSETPQDDSGLVTPQDESLTKLCNDVAARIEARIKQQRQSLNEQRYLFRVPAQMCVVVHSDCARLISESLNSKEPCDPN